MEKMLSAINTAFIRLPRDAEYGVYVFLKPACRDVRPGWERKHTTPCVKRAFARARALHRSNQYQKIEIRKKYFDSRADRQRDQIVRIFREDSPPLLLPALVRSDRARWQWQTAFSMAVNFAAASFAAFSVINAIAWL